MLIAIFVLLVNALPVWVKKSPAETEKLVFIE